MHAMFLERHKKMRKLVLSVVVLALCAPGYAEVLVYKFNTSYKMIEYIDPNRTVTHKSSVTESIKAFVVFNIDSSTPLNVVRLDAGNRPTAILYGKSKTEGKWKKTIGGDDPNSAVLIMTAESDVLGIQTFNSYTVSGKSEQRTAVTLIFIDEPNGIQPFEIVADVRGKDSKTGRDLFPKTIYLPWNLSGITSMTSGDETSATFVSGQATSGKLKINFPKIKSAIDNDWDVAQTVEDIDNSQTLASYPDLGTEPIPVP
jgi:hypothetical protein